MHTFYEFFAGGGMARLGLGPKWRCLFANDIDPKKAVAYRANFDGAPELKLRDVAELKSRHLPGQPDLVWASFPCQDLSLAGGGAGLRGERSGTFWPFWKLMRQIIREGRGPRLVALENVCGTLTSHGGRDFAAIGDAIAEAGFRFGAFVLDAADFIPQSRPRLFFIGVAPEVNIPSGFLSGEPVPRLHVPAVMLAQDKLSAGARRSWLWWRLPPPKRNSAKFVDLLESNPSDVSWASLEDTRALLRMMSPKNLAKVQKAQLAGRPVVGGIYRRTRLGENGKKIQRAEVRFDDVAGCLRTPIGGSSRQRIVLVEGNRLRTRLISARETARLMGLPETYRLPERYNDAYHLTGDGVVVPVVRHITQFVLEPLLGQGDLAVAAE